MNESGVLKFILTSVIVAMMQFNMYHHYTVDEHLLRCIAVLSEIEHGELENEQSAKPILSRQSSATATCFMWRCSGRHRQGAPGRSFRCWCAHRPQAGTTAGSYPTETETVEWLVREHLTMSMVAQSRDLNDRKTIIDFADTVQTMERLKLLPILTVCDIKAVGPGVWNGWKGQLLRTLFYETELVLTGGFSNCPVPTATIRREALATGSLIGRRTSAMHIWRFITPTIS